MYHNFSACKCFSGFILKVISIVYMKLNEYCFVIIYGFGFSITCKFTLNDLPEFGYFTR